MPLSKLNKMKDIRNLIAIALFAIAMIGCQKDQDLGNFNNSIGKAAVTNSANHTHSFGRKCASTAHMQEKLQDPAFKADYETRMRSFSRSLRTNVAKSRSACSSPTILPIAYHFDGIGNADKACLVELVKQQTAILNADFQGSNSDIVQWTNTAAPQFPGISNGAACLEFCVATKNHPAGFGLNEGDLAITVNQVTEGNAPSKWAGYINIIVNDADGNLGYAPLGGSGNGDAIVLNKTAFGGGGTCGQVTANAPFNLGRTLTHEMGHYLNLDHIWGEGCGTDDGVADTPSQEADNGGCPSIGITSCGTKDLFMNYMDYVDDACMFMFSAGQVSRMESWVRSSGLLSNLKSSSEVCGGAGTVATNNTPTTPTPTTPTTPTGNTSIDTDNSTDTEEGDIATSDEEEDTDASNEEDYDDYYEEEGDDTDQAISMIRLQVTLDDFGSETTFDIEDGSGDLIETWGPFEDGIAGEVISVELELPLGIYSFVIYDSYGDGICCTEGAGQWLIEKDGSTLATSNGEFGAWEAYDFTVGSARMSGDAHRVAPKDFDALSKKVKAVVRK